MKGIIAKNNEIKSYLKDHSAAYFKPRFRIDDSELATKTMAPVGSMVSRFDLDLAEMEPAARAALEERILRYHTAPMQAVSAEVSIAESSVTLERHLARLAGLAAEEEEEQE